MTLRWFTFAASAHSMRADAVQLMFYVNEMIGCPAIWRGNGRN